MLTEEAEVKSVRFFFLVADSGWMRSQVVLINIIWSASSLEM